MHALKAATQSFAGDSPMRLLLIAIYIIVMYRFFWTVPHSDVFIGMVRPVSPGETFDLVASLYPIAYMAFGLALPLGCDSRYLCTPDYLVYIRKPRGVAQFLRYLGVVTAECAVFSVPQSMVTAWLLPDVDQDMLVRTSLCSALILMALVLIVNLAYLMNAHGVGYGMAGFVYLVVIAIPPIRQWLGESSFPCIVTLVVVVAILALTDWMVFDHVQIQ